jgi:hypothetical protein
MEAMEPINSACRQLGLAIQTDASATKQLLVDRINQLIINDFEQLVSLLYRLDVSEAKINELLQTYPQEDAALIIVDLVIAREAEKIKSRREWSGKKYDENSGEEKW